MSSFSENIKKADLFHQDIEILFENGKPKLQTHCGVVLGLIMIATIVSYGYMKAGIMLNFKDNTIQEPTQDNYFAPDYVYDARDGWRVAFGLTAFDSSSDPAPFDDTYGTVGAYIKIWGEKDAAGNSTPTYFKKLETEPCKDSDINIDNVENQDKFKFFAPAPEFANDVKRFKNVLNCIKNDDHELMGDYNSAAAKQLVITFEMCRRGKTPGVNCKSESVIKDWMARKFLLTMENQIEFNKDLVEKDKLKKSSRLIFNVLSP